MKVKQYLSRLRDLYFLEPIEYTEEYEKIISLSWNVKLLLNSAFCFFIIVALSIIFELGHTFLLVFFAAIFSFIFALHKSCKFMSGCVYLAIKSQSFEMFKNPKMISEWDGSIAIYLNDNMVHHTKEFSRYYDKELSGCVYSIRFPDIVFDDEKGFPNAWCYISGSLAEPPKTNLFELKSKKEVAKNLSISVCYWDDIKFNGDVRTVSWRPKENK